MNSKRVYIVMIGLLIIGLLSIVGGAYAASSQLKKQSDTLVALKLRSQTLASESASLTKAKKDIAKYTSLNTIAKTIVPQDKDQAQAVREIIKIATESGISPTSITFPTSDLGAAGAAPVAVATPAAGSAGSAATPIPMPKKLPSQLTPVIGIPGVYNLAITIQQDNTRPVSYTKFIDFLSRLEQNRRTAQVTSITLQPIPADRNSLSFTLVVNQYIKP